MDVTEKTLDCPFCNTEESRFTYLIRSWCHIKKYQILCFGCQALGPQESSEEEAIKSWNKRNLEFLDQMD
ncbi:MAG: hypothetical protein H8D23_14625 [Candidatus Brocadiales bacterium]|nr:hypothetical protein [Candidatus Brocadiales bacterium]